MRRRTLPTSLAGGLIALPGSAQAHLVTSGLGPFYDGALHLLTSPGDLLGLVALALLAGLRGRASARLAVITLPTAWLIAGLVGMNLTVTFDLAGFDVVYFAVLGLLVAADARLSPRVIMALAVLYGALHGLLDGATLSSLGVGATSLFGIVLTGLVLMLLASAAVVPVKAFWARVAVRVAGSWIVAVGLLMLGWMAQGMA